MLTDDDDGLDPVAEETRSILDGHIVLSRSIAEQNRFPAIDVLASLSRLARQLVTAYEQEAASQLRKLLAKYRDIEFLLQVGEYEKGSDALGDEAIARHDAILNFLQQTPEARMSADESTVLLFKVLGMSPGTGTGSGIVANVAIPTAKETS